MGGKNRINNLYQQRNGCNMVSLGDKNYRSPEYATNYFREGGLVAGSTNRAKTNTGGQGKNIDFYSGLKLDGPLNKNSKTYVQVTKKQQLDAEIGDVSDLKEWERTILTEVDPQYDPDDDSSDEEQIAKRKARDDAAKEAEAEAVEKGKPVGKKK